MTGTTYRRWAYLLAGAAMLVPYLLVAAVGLNVVTAGRSPGWAALPMAVLLAWVTGLFWPVRRLEATVAAPLLGVAGGGGVSGGEPERLSWNTRWRAAVWFTVHLTIGGLIGALTAGVMLACLVLLTGPFEGLTIDLTFGGPRLRPTPGWAPAWAPLAAPVVVLLAIVAVSGIGRALTGLAPLLLGPSPAEQAATFRRQVEALAVKNELSQRVHDSVGHALTLNVMQAGAAARLIETQPEFARAMLNAIEETSRTALQDLDHVLSLLRDDPAVPNQVPPGPPRTLADLDQLLTAIRSAGTTVQASVTGPVAALPQPVSREAYRIVQEALTNALRHAGSEPITLRVSADGQTLDIHVTNPLPADRSSGQVPGPGSRGRGLDVLRHRIASLGGTIDAGPGQSGRDWRLTARLPVSAG